MRDASRYRAAVIVFTVLAPLVLADQQHATAVSPTHADIRDGRFQRNVLDIYLPDGTAASGKTPLPESTNQDLSIHHPRFGQLLKQKLDDAGVECIFRYKGDTSSITLEQFLKKHLLR